MTNIDDMIQNLITGLVKAREEKEISQKKLEELSGIKQPMIARIEKGKAVPNTDTLIKLLFPLGKTLAIVPLEPAQKQNNDYLLC